MNADGTAPPAAGAPAPEAPTEATQAPAPGPSLTDLLGQLLHDALELLALESRAAALTIALLVFLAVAAGCFVLFAWLSLGAIVVVAVVNAGYSATVALTAFALVNVVLAILCVLLLQRLTKSIVFGVSSNGDSKEEKKDA
jgi:uncharacterized membrane protein YqjE